MGNHLPEIGIGIALLTVIDRMAEAEKIKLKRCIGFDSLTDNFVGYFSAVLIKNGIAAHKYIGVGNVTEKPCFHSLDDIVTVTVKLVGRGQ